MKTTPLSYARAKRMRHAPTEAERKLWGALRNRSLGGLKFYRQVPVGPFIVDFINRECGVIVEVDGATHAEVTEIEHDERRRAFLKSQGLHVHRIDNIEIFKNIGAVLDGIHAVLMEQGG